MILIENMHLSVLIGCLLKKQEDSISGSLMITLIAHVRFPISVSHVCSKIEKMQHLRCFTGLYL